MVDSRFDSDKFDTTHSSTQHDGTQQHKTQHTAADSQTARPQQHTVFSFYVFTVPGTGSRKSGLVNIREQNNFGKKDGFRFSEHTVEFDV